MNGKIFKITELKKDDGLNSLKSGNVIVIA